MGNLRYEDGILNIDSVNINSFSEETIDKLKEQLDLNSSTGPTVDVTESLSTKELNIIDDTSTVVSTYSIENPEWLSVTLDNDDKIISGIRTDGTYYINNINSNTITNINNEIEKLKLVNNSKLKYKTIVCFGDSITEFSGTDGRKYTDWLEQNTGATVINVGIGGTQYRVRSNTDTGYAGLDIYNMVKAACTQDFSIVETAAEEIKNTSSDNNIEIIERLKNIDWNNVDIVTFFAGTNDWHNNGGNTENEFNKFDKLYTLGAIRSIIKMLCETYKHIKIFVFTPIIRCIDAPQFDVTKTYEIGDLVTNDKVTPYYYKFISHHEPGEWDVSEVEPVERSAFRIDELYSDNVYKNGKTLHEFSSLIQKTFEEYHIPVYDLYNKLGWNLYNFSNYFNDYDNTHPYKGYAMIAEKIQSFIESNF